MEEISVVVPRKINLAFVKKKKKGRNTFLANKTMWQCDFSTALANLPQLGMICAQAREDDVSSILLLKSIFNILPATDSLKKPSRNLLGFWMFIILPWKTILNQDFKSLFMQM